MKQLFFTNKALPNFHLEINAQGCIVWVSLNVESDMLKHLYKGNLYKAEKMWVYALKDTVKEVNFINIEAKHQELLNKAMINLREAKQKVLQDEINNLKILQK